MAAAHVATISLQFAERNRHGHGNCFPYGEFAACGWPSSGRISSSTSNHVEAMRLLARIGLELDVLDDARKTLLEAVLELAPDYPRRPLRLRHGAAAARHKHVEAGH